MDDDNMDVNDDNVDDDENKEPWHCINIGKGHLNWRDKRQKTNIVTVKSKNDESTGNIQSFLSWIHRIGFYESHKTI